MIIAPPPPISRDPFGEEQTLEQKYSVLDTLTVAQYTKWLRKNVRKYGRRGEFGNGRQNAVEVFVQDATGIDICFTASGEVEINGEQQCYMLSGWRDIAYYTYDGPEDEEATFVTTYGQALKTAEWQAARPFIVDWHFAG